LAAVELSSLYQKDKFDLDEKINILRWDETIILFISLLSPKQSEVVLRQIAETDIVFACRAFESAAIQEQTIGHQLFDIISQKLSKPHLSIPEKENIAQAIRHIGPYGKKEVLLKLLGDKVIARAAAIVLAQIGVKEAVPKIIELLLNDNIWPSDFVKALTMLTDESIIPQLIEYGKQVEEDSLTESNLAEILSNFECEELYSEISKLVQSEIVKERQFAVEILEKIDSERAREFLVQKLSDSDSNVQWRVIFGLRRRFDRKPYKSEAITAQMFDLLADKEVGDSAARYLRDITDDAVIKEATSRLQFPRNEYEQINLCAIIAKYDPETSKRMLFNTLENYNPSFHKTLYAALASLDKEYILPDIFAYLKTNNKDIRLTVLETLRWALPHEEQIVIDKESCENLITLWETTDEDMEKHIVGFLLTDQCSTMSKDMLLKRLSDVTYPFREELIEFVERLSLIKGDLSLDVIEWLITKLHYTNEEYLMFSWNAAASILGSVCDEGILKEKLIPLLNSNNEVLRSNAYIAVSKAERVLGKRFIKK
jgi:HEAT repeat protein